MRGKEHGSRVRETGSNTSLLAGAAITSELRKRTRVVVNWTFFYAWIGFIMTLLENELRMYDPWEMRHVVVAVTTANSLSTIFLLFSITQYYRIRVQMLIARHNVPKSATVGTSGLLGSYLVEVLICLIHTPPFLAYPYETAPFGEYTDDVIQVINTLLLLRVYLLVRVLRENSKLMMAGGHVIGEMANIDFDTVFITKSIINSHPITIVTACLLVTLVLSAYTVFIFERFSHPNPLNMLDAIWLIIISMTTVGYGDLVPTTDVGKAAAIISSGVGVFLTALIIAVIHHELQLTTPQLRIIGYMQRSEIAKQTQLLAAATIEAAYVAHLVRKRKLGTHRAHLAELRLFQTIRQFRETRKRVAGDQGSGFFIESMEHQVKNLGAAMDRMTEKLNSDKWARVRRIVAGSQQSQQIVIEPASPSSPKPGALDPIGAETVPPLARRGDVAAGNDAQRVAELNEQVDVLTAQLNHVQAQLGAQEKSTLAALEQIASMDAKVSRLVGLLTKAGPGTPPGLQMHAQ